MLGDEVANAAPPFFGELRGMARRDQAMIGMLREMPRRVKNAGVSRLRGARRHEHGEAISVSGRHLLQLLDQQAVMPGRLEPDEPAVFS